MKDSDYKIITQDIFYALDVGIHVVDKQGKTIIYNKAMARLEKMEQKDVLEKPFREAFSNLKESESTLLQALKFKSSIVKNRQTYLNKYGKEIVTNNITAPIMDGDRLLGAVEIAKDVTEIEIMSNTILKLQGDDQPKRKTEKPEIRKYNFGDIFGQDEIFVEAIGVARKASENDSSVLLYGETGTGKELVAQSIHYSSERKDKPFLAQNCAALPETLLEGILFGTARGGFTGAVDRVGLFEQADGGTLLLDEISAMPFELQSKLLRVLQEDYIRPIGGTKDIPIDVRIIATINEPADKLMAEGKLRKDLYYRINIIHIDLPPLRERPSDIMGLAEVFLKKHAGRAGKNMRAIAEEAKEKLLDYDYPGNVRELENLIMSAVSLSGEGNVLLAENIIIPDSTMGGSAVHFKGELDKYLSSLERDIIKAELLKFEGNISRTAESLGMKRQTLQHKLRKYDIK